MYLFQIICLIMFEDCIKCILDREQLFCCKRIFLLLHQLTHEEINREYIYIFILILIYIFIFIFDMVIKFFEFQTKTENSKSEYCCV